MFRETFLVTALPNGTGRLGTRVSALLSPRLQWAPGDFAEVARLDDLPSVFRSWVQTAHAGIEQPWVLTAYDDDGEVLERIEAKPVSKVDKGVLQTFFGRKLAVRSWAFPQEVVERPVVSLPVADIEDWLLENYEKAGPAGIGGPLRGEVVQDALADLVTGQMSQAERGRMLAGRAKEAANKRKAKQVPIFDGERAAIRKHDSIAGAHPDAAMLTWARALLDPRTPRKPVKPKVPDLELHELLGLLSDHPALQRALGLVVDFTVRKLPPKTARISIAPPHLRGAASKPLQTAVSKTFRAAPRDDVHALSPSGFLRLDDDRFDVLELEVEQAVLALAAQSETAGDRKTDTLPALSTRGLAVAWSGREDAITARLDRAAALQEDLDRGATEVVLYAEDLVAGYAIDVAQSRDNVWRSLCARQGGYVDDRGRTLLKGVTDELPVQDTTDEVDAEAGGATVSAAVTNERLFQWTGWSLAVPKPGRPMDLQGNAPGDPDTTAIVGIRPQLEVPPGSLPKLRYGELYRFRARVVDLAGNRVDVDSTDATHATAGVTWRRYLPILPPVRVFEGDPNEKGAGRQRLVARTTNLVNPDQPTVRARDARTIWMGPVRAGVDQVIAEGVLDAPDGSSAQQVQGFAAQTWQVLSRRSEAYPVQVEADGSLELSTILADPMVTGAWVEAEGAAPLPSHPFSIAWIGDQDRWPTVRSAAITLAPLPRGANPTASWDDNTRTLTVGLPPAMKARYLLRGRGPISNLGLYAVLTSFVPDGHTIQEWSMRLAEEGHAFLDPKEPLELVHAVRVPLDPPNLVGAPGRDEGDTHVDLDGHIETHVPSTGQVQVLAAWEDIENAPDTDDGFRMVSRSAVVCTLGVPENLPTLGVKLPPARLELGDTRYRPISYTPRAHSRFIDCFTGTAPTHRDGAERLRQALSTRAPDAPELVDVVPVFKWERSAIGNAVGKQRISGLRVLMKGAWFSSGHGEQLGLVVRGSVAPSAAAGDAMSHVGRDPTEAGGAVVQRELLASQVRDFDGTANASLRMHGGAAEDIVGVVGHHPTWDRARQLWVVDVRLELGQTAYPFVQLALARFQPSSLQHLELSPIVRAGFRQLAPDRHCVLVPQGGQSWFLSVRAADASGGAEGQGVGTTTMVTVESRVDRPQVEAGWKLEATSQTRQASSAPIRILHQGSGDPHTLWAGRVVLSSDLDPALHRVVVREVQQVGAQHRVVAFITFRLG